MNDYLRLLGESRYKTYEQKKEYLEGILHHMHEVLSNPGTHHWSEEDACCANMDHTHEAYEVLTGGHYKYVAK